MKIARKLLPLMLVAILLISVISTSVSAAPQFVKAGDGTVVEEYLDFEVIKDAGFENGMAKSLYTTDVPNNTKDYRPEVIEELAKVETSSLNRPAKNHIYAADGEESTYFHTVNYDYNTYGKDVYSVINILNAADKDLAEKGMVIEFDVTVFPREDGTSGAPNSAVDFNLLNDGNAMGNGLIKFFGIEKDPSSDENFLFVAGGTKQEFKQGGWVHITIHYVPADAKYYVYAGGDEDNEGQGRKLFAEVPTWDNARKIDVLPMCIRAGNTQATSGQVSLDNFIAYQSYTVRNPYHFERLDDSGKVKMLVDAVMDDNTAANTKHELMQLVNDEYLSNFWDGQNFYPSVSDETCTLLTSFMEYYEEQQTAIMEAAKALNLKEYKAYLAKLDETPRNLINYTVRDKVIADMLKFLEGCGDVMATEDATYAETLAKHAALDAEYAYDKLVTTFLNAADKFTNAKKLGSIVTMKKRLVEAKEAYAIISPAPTAEMYDAEDPTSKTKVADALAVLVDGDGLIEQMERDANTTRFVAIVDKISKTTPADWANDDGTIESLWLLALNIKSDGYYTYGMDFAEAEMRFADVNAFFWDKIQQKHISVLQAKIDSFGDVNYIDKEGVCAFIDSYLVRYKNEIDLDRSEIKAIIALNEQYKSKLPDYEKNYKDLLVANTAAFLATVKSMEGVTVYDELKAIYDKASEYYYSMNLVGDDVMAAMATYQQVGRELEEKAYASNVYLLAINALSENSTEDEKYAAIFTCYQYGELIDMTYAGVTEAKAEYDELYAAYTAYSVDANATVSEAMNVACSVRSFCGFADLVKVLIDLFTN